MMAFIFKYRNKYGRMKFFRLLSNSFKQNKIYDKDDILILLNSINRECHSNYSLASILEDYIVYISKSDNYDKNDPYKILKDIINFENQEKPFNNIPDEEKMILRNINENIKNNQLESVKHNINELCSVITTRNKIYEKTNKINKLSIPFAIIGIIVAIIFGLMSLKNIDYKKIEEINTKLIEKTIQQ
jgi:hypothetical protein